jgi:hypothetical protein
MNRHRRRGLSRRFLKLETQGKQIAKRSSKKGLDLFIAISGKPSMSGVHRAGGALSMEYASSAWLAQDPLTSLKTHNSRLPLTEMSLSDKHQGEEIREPLRRCVIL